MAPTLYSLAAAIFGAAAGLTYNSDNPLVWVGPALAALCFAALAHRPRPTAPAPAPSTPDTCAEPRSEVEILDQNIRTLLAEQGRLAMSGGYEEATTMQDYIEAWRSRIEEIEALRPNPYPAGSGIESASKNKLGLYGKFTVYRNDHKDLPGEKHHNCFLFVLDLSHDPHSIPALTAYAESCAEDYPVLAEDLREAICRVTFQKEIIDE